MWLEFAQLRSTEAASAFLKSAFRWSPASCKTFSGNQIFKRNRLKRYMYTGTGCMSKTVPVSRAMWKLTGATRCRVTWAGWAKVGVFYRIRYNLRATNAEKKKNYAKDGVWTLLSICAACKQEVKTLQSQRTKVDVKNEFKTANQLQEVFRWRISHLTWKGKKDKQPAEQNAASQHKRTRCHFWTGCVAFS